MKVDVYGLYLIFLNLADRHASVDSYGPSEKVIYKMKTKVCRNWICKGLKAIPWALAFTALFIPLACTRPEEKQLAEAERAYASGEYNKALALSDAILQKLPGELAAHRLKALSYIRQGLIQEALNGYDQVENRHPKIAPALLKEIAVAMIREALAHENFFVRSAAVKAVGEMGDPNYTSLIVPSMRDPETFVRFFAVESLGMLGGGDALKLIMAASGDPDGMVRMAAVKVLDEMGDENKNNSQLINLLATFSNDQDMAVRLFAWAAMARLGDEGAYAKLIAAVEALENDGRIAGVAALGRSKKVETAPLLQGFIRDSNPSIRMYAAEAMGELSEPSLYPSLVEALADQEASVRGAAATSLGKLGNQAAAPELKKLLNDPEAMVRVSAAEGLKRLGIEELAVFKSALSEPDYGVRHFAIGSLRRTWGEAAMPLLQAAAEDSAQRVRIAAVRAIGDVAGLERLPLLKEALNDPDLAVRTYAAGNVARVLNKAAGFHLKRAKVD